jgi:protein-S-isoprenylcysteine O-methyltransferase Ste14
MPPLDIIWVAIGLVWLAGSLTSKKTVRSAPATFTVVHIILLIMAGLLLFTRWFEPTVLGTQILPSNLGVYYTGLALAALGAAFAIWARLYLGRNWSGFVTVKQDHELIRSGPYALVRHPIYTGFLLAIFGTAIVEAQIRGFLAFVIFSIAWHFKARVEERFMVEQFGQQYEVYRCQVKGLIPYIL